MTNFDKYLEEEERFFSKDKKSIKKLRKIKSHKDKSKYKKTNIKPDKNKTAKENQKEGRVLSIHGQEILVSYADKEYICTLRGVLKKERHKNKNLIAVGDFVDFLEKNEQEGVIENIKKRYSILSREEKLRQKQHIIAANIDQVLITSSVIEPSLKPHLIDRYIIASIKGNMHPIIVINKIDLLKKDKKENKKYKEFVKLYKKLGFIVVSVSSKTKKGLRVLFSKMKKKTSVFSGQSGVGKSSIINTIFKTNLKTGVVTKKTAKGAHITTKAKLIPLKEGGFCIDTPGIKGFGIWDLNIDDVIQYFSEIQDISKNCKYPNCTHINEPECAVLKALKENKISSLRFDSYSSLIEDILNKKRTKYE